MNLRRGARVTVTPADSDPIILHMQRYATVARPVDGGALVTLDAAIPLDAEYGPIPAERLAPGWRDERGRWR